MRRDGEGSPPVARQQPCRRREQDPIPTLKRQATTSGEHEQLVAQDQDLDIACRIMGIAGGSQKPQKPAEGKVEKRR